MIATLLSLSGCQSLWYQFLNYIVDIAPDRFVFEEDHKKLSIPIYSSHPLTKNNNEFEYLIVIIHGGGLNAGKTFETGQQIFGSLKIDKKRMMILAPQFLEGVDLDEKGLLFWDQRWRGGGKSLSTGLNTDLPKLSSFEVLDRLIDVVTKQNPNMRRIIILGHSAGGQFVYGLDELYGYAETLSPQIVRTRLLTRPVLFVIGTEDTDRDWVLDKSCEGDSQGKNRYERGLLYKHHLRPFVKNSPKSQHNYLNVLNYITRLIQPTRKPARLISSVLHNK